MTLIQWYLYVYKLFKRAYIDKADNKFGSHVVLRVFKLKSKFFINYYIFLTDNNYVYLRL